MTPRLHHELMINKLLTLVGRETEEQALRLLGGCPHTAIREDASINLKAITRMRADFPELDLILIEFGGDNLAATFRPELSDLTIYVIDVAGGEKTSRKGGLRIARADLLIINKTDLAPHVGANLDVMAADAQRMRGIRPFVFSNLRAGAGLELAVAFIQKPDLPDKVS